MSHFNYKVRIPTDKEYNRLMDVTDENNSIVHWNYMFSWVDNPKFVAEHPASRSLRGYISAHLYTYVSAGHRSVNVGFRPAFESLGNDTASTGAADGNVVVVGTLYMDGKPVKVPQNPVFDGDIENYIPGAKLEFGPAHGDSTYQVQAIKVGDVFICDRCLLKNISYDDICDNFKNEPPIDAKSNSVVSINPCNCKVRIPTNTEYERLLDITADNVNVINWKGIFSLVDDSEYTAKHPGYCVRRGYYSACYLDHVPLFCKTTTIGFRPAFEPISLPVGIKDGDSVVIGTLYMDGKPVKIPQIPTWNGDIRRYISDAALEFKPALENPEYQVRAIKVGNAFICDRCLLERISYDDIAANLKGEPALNVKHNIELTDYQVRIPTDGEYNQLIDVAKENDVVVHWKNIFSWLNDPKFAALHPGFRAVRGCYSGRFWNGYSPSARTSGIGFRPALELMDNAALPADITDGDAVIVGTLYMDNEPVKVSQNPALYGSVKNYIPGAELRFGPALKDPNYQVQAIKCGNVFVCDRCLLTDISYDDITASFSNKSVPNIKTNINPSSYQARIPADTEYNHMMEIAPNNAVTHGENMFSWVNDPEYKSSTLRGGDWAESYTYTSANYRDVCSGFRPAFDPLDNNTLPTDISDGDIVVIGTLYMNGEPVKVPQNPVYNGDVEDYIPGAKLEFKLALEDPEYQVLAIRAGNVFVCDRCLLKNISYHDIENALIVPNVSSMEAVQEEQAKRNNTLDEGSEIWVLKRNINGKLCGIARYMFLTKVGSFVIVSPYIRDMNKPEEILKYHAEKRVKGLGDDLEVFHESDCCSSIQEVKTALDNAE